MNARTRVGVVVVVVAVSLCLGGTAHARRAPKPKAEPPLSARIVGEWMSEPFESSVGKATQTFCFRADGTMAVRTESSAGPLSSSGTYALEADRVTVKLTNPESAVVLRVGWSAERLVLTDESGQARSYSRGPNGC